MMKAVFAVLVIAGICAGLSFFIGMRSNYYRAFKSRRDGDDHNCKECDQCLSGYLCPAGLGQSPPPVPSASPSVNGA